MTGFARLFETQKKPNYGFYPNGFCQRLTFWENSGHPCAGKHLHGICQFTLADLPYIEKHNSIDMKETKLKTNHQNTNKKIQNCFIANKFSLDVDPLAVLCQARRLL